MNRSLLTLAAVLLVFAALVTYLGQRGAIPETNPPTGPANAGNEGAIPETAPPAEPASAGNDYRCPDCNVILIVVDALRPDHLGCYGYARNTSPNIDRLAEEGVLFESAIAQAPWTLPSFASMLTSLYPKNHMVTRPDIKLNSTITTLAEPLKESGVKTVAIITTLPQPQSGLDFGFLEYLVGQDEDDVIYNVTSKEAVIWLDKNRGERFFMIVHYRDPHTPYNPPAQFRETYFNDTLFFENKQVALRICKSLLNCTGIPRWTAVDNITKLNYYIALYDGEISSSDNKVGTLLKKLQDLNLTNNTLIMLTADHGESMGEHRLYFTHGTYVYDELIRVPLIAKLPGKFPEGKRVSWQVQHIDIMPTILDFLNISAPDVDGTSLIPTIRGDANGTEYAFSEHDEFVSVRTNGWKLIYNRLSTRKQLYNLDEDPKELENLIYENPEKAAELKDKLLAWAEANRGLYPKKIDLDEETIEELMALGYMT